MVRVAEVVDRTRLSRSCLYALIAKRVFPLFVEISDRARGVPEHELDAWLASRIAARSEMTRLLDPVVLPLWKPGCAVGDTCKGIRLLRRAEVLERIGLGSSQVYRLIEGGRFPAPIPVTSAARRWVEHEVDEWLRSRIAASLRISGVPVRRAPREVHASPRANRLKP